MNVLVHQEKDNSSYRFLKLTEIVDYAKKNNLFNEYELVSIDEVSDGKINHVYRLRGEEKSIIFKQAVPFARVVGESMPLPLDRVRIEARVLQEYDKIIPGLVPKVLHLDENMAVVVTEDMFPMVMGRTALIEGTESRIFAANIGEMSARTLFFTSDFYLNPVVKKELNASLSNPGMRKLTEELVFDWPYSDHETNHFEEGMTTDVLLLSKDNRLKLEVAQLKHKFMTKADALIHSDLHSGAIFMDEHKTVMFDTEFACFGPFGFDLGQFIGNLLLNGISFPEFMETRYNQARETWYTFADTFLELWRTESNEAYTKVDGYYTAVMDEVFVDVLGYAGCEMIRRAISIAQIDDMNTEVDEQKRMVNRKKVLEVGRNLILERNNIKSVEELYSKLIQTNEL